MKTVILFLALGLLGCGGSSSSNPTDPKSSGTPSKTGPVASADREELKTDLLQLSLALDISSQTTGQFAKDVNELKPFMEGANRLIERINSGKVTVNWGAKNPITWYAYETEGLKSGGLVAVRSERPVDGVVQKSADEIKKIVGK